MRLLLISILISNNELKMSNIFFGIFFFGTAISQLISIFFDLQFQDFSFIIRILCSCFIIKENAIVNVNRFSITAQFSSVSCAVVL
jgi:hypothetical protein